MESVTGIYLMHLPNCRSNPLSPSINDTNTLIDISCEVVMTVSATVAKTSSTMETYAGMSAAIICGNTLSEPDIKRHAIEAASDMIQTPLNMRRRLAVFVIKNKPLFGVHKKHVRSVDLLNSFPKNIALITTDPTCPRYDPWISLLTKRSLPDSPKYEPKVDARNGMIMMSPTVAASRYLSQKNFLISLLRQL